MTNKKASLHRARSFVVCVVARTLKAVFARSVSVAFNWLIKVVVAAALNLCPHVSQYDVTFFNDRV